MKNKFFALMTMSLVTMALALVVSAQMKKNPNSPLPIPRGQKVSLTCTPGGGKDVSTPLYVKNPTAQDIAANTLIYYSATQGGTPTNSKQTAGQILKKNNGNEISLLGPPGGVASCQAWIIK
ncbi:MAG: hypothetical protein HYR56_15340 [Acidobacteria bacterium]|nr:hypothetical protein [Acidobacteriota bacterium]MBI3426878.1 hypothetical protein [Acidobacteriota bacterium]